MSRLETLSSELAVKLRQATEAEQRTAGLAAAHFAASHTRVEYPVVSEALITLRAGGSLSPEDTAQLKDLTVQLDDKYLDLREASEEGRATADEYMRVFSQARAVAAVLYAFGDDPFQAAAEAIYEAAAVTDDPRSLFCAIGVALR